MDERLTALLRSALPLLGDQPLTPDTPLTDLGMDSVAAVMLFMDIQKVFGVSLSDDDLVEATFATPDTLWKVISRNLGVVA
ncbi:MAG: acyl carrier protein [Catenulispora sp.]